MAKRKNTMEGALLSPIAACVLIAILHLVGRIGFAFEVLQPVFQRLIWFNLLVSTFLVFYFHKKWNTRFVITMAVIFLIGIIIEIIGVQTGAVFGEYTYTNLLGPKILGVPVLIGINWATLSYCVWQLIKSSEIHWLYRVILGAVMMVIIDFVLEPFATQFDLWNWKDFIIPVNNYIAWGVISFVMMLLLRRADARKPNWVGACLYLVQLLYFLTFLS